MVEDEHEMTEVDGVLWGFFGWMVEMLLLAVPMTVFYISFIMHYGYLTI